MTAADTIQLEQSRSRRLTQVDIDGFVAAGVPPLALAQSWAGDFAAIGHDRVVFEQRTGRFEFARNVSSAVGGEEAFTLALFDAAGDPSDVVAVWPERPTSLWLGRVAMLGEEQVRMLRFGEPLDVHETFLDWLRADRRGVVILHARRAAGILDGVQLRASSAEYARRLRTTLVRPAPPIEVRAEAVAVRAA